MSPTKVYSYEIAKFDFFNTAVADILRALDGGAVMGSAILSFCCLDYMGMAIDPFKKKNSGNDFKKFISDYLGRINSRYQSSEDDLWAVRNSLVHVYGESDATKKRKIGFDFTTDDQNVNEYDESNSHLQHFSDKISIDVPELVGELVAAVELFFRENKANDKLMMEWYRKLIIIQGAPGWLERLETNRAGRPLHHRSHRLLNILDNEPEEDVSAVRRSVISGVRDKLRELGIM